MAKQSAIEQDGVTVVEQEGYEADDILGTIAKESAAKGIDVSIVSGDRDLLQLADEHIKIRIPKTKKGVTEVEDYYPSDVFNLYGVTPHEFIDVKALMGDTSDNIPGAPGIGPKTASASYPSCSTTVIFIALSSSFIRGTCCFSSGCIGFLVPLYPSNALCLNVGADKSNATVI